MSTPTLDALLKVSSQLETLQRQVNAIAENATRQHESGGKGLTSSSSQGSLSRTAAVPSALALDTASSDDDSHYVRPSHYPHAPASRLDALETNNFSETPLMEALKLDSFSGFYNLALFLLFFAFAYLIVRSFREKGNQLTLSDFTCSPLKRDAMDAAVVITSSYLWSFSFYLALRAWIHKKISWRTLRLFYCFAQAILVLGPVLFIYSSPIAPMPAAAVLMVSIVLGLKSHSYVFTNWLVYAEQKSKYGKDALSLSENADAAAGGVGDGSSSARTNSSSARSKSSKKGGKRGGGVGGTSTGKEHESGPEDDSDDDGGGDDDDSEKESSGRGALVPSSSSAKQLRRRNASSKKGKGGGGGDEDDPSSASAAAALALASTAATDDEGAAFGAAGAGRNHPSGSPRSDFLRRQQQQQQQQQQNKKGAATPGKKGEDSAPTSTSRKDSLDAFSLSGDAPASSSSSVVGVAAEGGAADGASTPGLGLPTAAQRGRQHAAAVKSWPHNVTLRDFSFFVMAPTLVYEPRFPRTRKRRWSYIARKLLEMALCFALQYLIMRQFMIPVLKNPSQPRDLDTPEAAAHGYYGLPGSTTRNVHVTLATAGAFVFDMMKLAIPSLLVWLLGFYALFHCWLNILAELLRFADRTFFLDFWNSTTLDAFWRKWNIPVHEWCLRHVYLDLQTYSGVNKSAAVLATFFFSAVFHELIFSVAFKTFRPWFFIGMLAQIPLISLGRSWKNKRRGNYLVWWSLFSGQPLLELLYFREFFSSHASFFCVTEAAPVAVAVDKIVTQIAALGAAKGLPNATAAVAAAAASVAAVVGEIAGAGGGGAGAAAAGGNA